MISLVSHVLQPFFGYFSILTTVLFLLFLALYIRKKYLYQKDSAFWANVTRLMQQTQPNQGIENHVNVILEIFNTIMEAQGYAFYVRDDKSQKFMLKAVRFRNEDLGPIAPSYSGLVPYKMEEYQPPISLGHLEYTQIELINDGDVQLLNIPFPGGKGIVQIGPLSALPPKKILAALERIRQLLPNSLDQWLELDQMKARLDLSETSQQALKTIGLMAMDTDAVLKRTFTMSSHSLGVSGGFLVWQEGSNFHVPVLFGWSHAIESCLTKDRELISMLWNLLGVHQVMALRPDNSRFKDVASRLDSRLAQLFLLCRCENRGKNVLLVYRIDQFVENRLSEEQFLALIHSFGKQLSQFVGMQEGIKPLSESYIELLKGLTRILDNTSPYTVGYSELMSRYSIIIAKEMGLTGQEISEIALAAFLSNIGAMGISEALYSTTGKLEDMEYEKIKLHAEIGAAIVEMTIGNKNVARLIRHHHERMDGNGYPLGLKGQEIPVGARVLAVVQTFLAKINGRNYREPLSFEKAIDVLRVSSGTQLDPSIVEVLIKWFKSKQSNLVIENRSMGPCWEMCCSPTEVCTKCPAFRQTDKNCWEFSRNNCKAHGKVCETCYVYTEAMSRKVGLK